MSTTKDDPSAFAVRPACPHERLAARLLLPESAVAGLLGTPWVMTDGSADDRPIVAAAAVGLEPKTRVEGRCLGEVGVVRTRRGEGLEGRMWPVLVDAARRHGAGLVCQHWVDADAPPPASGLGLRVVQSRYEFAAPSDVMSANLAKLYARLDKNGRVPADARVVSLRQATPDDVAGVVDLFLRHFPGTRHRLTAAVGGSGEEFDPDKSIVATHNGRVVGFLLGRMMPDIGAFNILWKAVDVPYRNAWANLALMHECSVRSMAVGVLAARYSALSHNLDTRRVVDHLGGELARTQVRYGCDAAGTP